MRIGIVAACAARTTCATLSDPPMFPGLMRTAATPASIALSARLALKWMSAMTGSGERRTILLSASASSVFGTATRTISQPAEASAAIWAVVASMSCVLVNVIDWTTTGAPPPILTPPTLISRSEAIQHPVYPGLSGRLRQHKRPRATTREADLGRGELMRAAMPQAPPLALLDHLPGRSRVDPTARAEARPGLAGA